jgi:hypothetical protein
MSMVELITTKSPTSQINHQSKRISNRPTRKSKQIKRNYANLAIYTDQMRKKTKFGCQVFLSVTKMQLLGTYSFYLLG